MVTGEIVLTVKVEEPVKKKWKRRKTNWNLRQKRNESKTEIAGFPLSKRIKPTSHPSYCYGCGEKIEKGSPELLLESGMWWRGTGNRVVGVGRNRYKGITIGATESLTPRYLRFHPDCLSCFLNKMYRVSNLSYLVNDKICETCSKRFDCFTSVPVLDFNERFGSFAYRPGRGWRNDELK